MSTAFEAVKASSKADLYAFLYHLPKGGDLHNHLPGAGLPEWWYEAALAERKNGYQYRTKVRFNNCLPDGKGARSDYYLLYKNLAEDSWQALSDCHKSEYKLLGDLNETEKSAWMLSLVLDNGEGRDEFFGVLFQRLEDFFKNPYLMAEILIYNMVAFGNEGVLYLETQLNAFGYRRADGSAFSPEETVAIFKARLAKPDAKNTGVVVRLQEAVVRFLPNAIEQVKQLYRFVTAHRDLYVSLNLVGIEDNSKGYARHFLSTFRELRRQAPLPLSIHAGESNEADDHIRQTLILGASRIGHGFNLLQDEDTLLLMRNSNILFEVNLISNLLLEYVSDYRDHPFPELLRVGVPVSLSTDDRGMFLSNLTDEFFVAVVEYNLTWEEVLRLNRNAIRYSFTTASLKDELMALLNRRLTQFEKRFLASGLDRVAVNKPVSYGFICQHYGVCDYQP